MATAVGPVLLLGGFAGVLGLALWAAVLALQRRSPRTPLRALLGMLLGYVLVVASGSLLSRDRPIALGTTLCFDDWCGSVTGVHAAPGPTPLQKLVVAEVRISSIARRIAQRGSDPHVYFIDTSGAWYRADRPVGTSPALGSRIGPGESFRTAIGGLVPAGATIAAVRFWEGAWIDDIMPFDEESPWHRKTFYLVEHT